MWPTTGRHSHSLKFRTMNVIVRWTVSAPHQSPPAPQKKRRSSEMPSAMASRRKGRSATVRSPKSTVSKCSQPRQRPSRLTSPHHRLRQKRMGHATPPRSMDLVSSVQLMGLGPLLSEVPPMSQTATSAGPAQCSNWSSGSARKEDATRTMTPGGWFDLVQLLYCIMSKYVCCKRRKYAGTSNFTVTAQEFNLFYFKN